jgi:hypothetical protein
VKQDEMDEIVQDPFSESQIQNAEESKNLEGSGPSYAEPTILNFEPRFFDFGDDVNYGNLLLRF